MIATGEKLILCAGPYRYEGCKTLDANPDYKPDYCAALPPIPRELRDGHWSEIFLIHGIEHFYRWECEELLCNIRECLMPGGLMVLEQPNLEFAARVLLGLEDSPTENRDASAINAIYGDPKHDNPFMAHKWGWTPATLTELVEKAGFREIKTGKALSRPWAKGRDFRLEATK